MAAPLIEHSFSAAGSSPEVLGYELGRNEPHNYAGVRNTAACFQVVRTAGATDAVDVRLERGIRRANNSIAWDEDKKITSVGTAANDFMEVTLCPGAMYRIRCVTVGAGNTLVGLFN